MALTTDSFKTIRSWNGSQNNAFEELCYQLRDPVTAGAELRKTGNPDRGYEWYELHSDGREWGWQAKYTFTIDEFLKLAEETLRTVVAERPNCERLTYCIPFDLPDVVPKKSGVRTGSSAWEKYEKWKEQRGTRVPGSESIEIQLWSAGDLLRRLNTPDNRGRAWFFWDENVLTLAWCREKLDIAKKVAGPRYTENLNVELPIADTLAGLARSEQFETGAARLCDAVVAAARSYFRTQDTSPDPDTAAITAVEAACAQLSGYAGSKFATVPKALHSVLSACFAALNPRLRTEDPSPAVWSITARLSELEKFITSEAAEAAESGTLLVSGQAGQGKTHLFIEVADGLVTAGHPAVVIMGGRLSGRNALGEIAETSIGSNNWDAMLGAMAAAGEAYGRPFVLLIDALNEADEPTRWREEFPAVVGEVGRYSPWVVIGASIRSTYLDVALPEVVPISPHVVHEGFAGREAAAVEAFFTHYGLGVPRTPPIGEAMSNPLFLTLYCKSRASGFLSASAAEKAHVSAVFDSFVSTVNKAVCKTLQLDPADRLVHSCVAYLASEFAGSGKEWVDRPSAKQYITSLAPHLTQWPKTLFEQLRSEGLIITDVARTGDRSVPVDVVRFAYQRFADYKIAEHLLEPISDGIALAAPGAEATRARIADASAGVIEALSVLVPEKFDVELLPAAPWELGDQHRVRWQRAFVDSLPNRGSSAITANTVALFEEIRATAAGLFARSAAALVELAVRPGHLLDVEYLHRDLAALAMPQRDATWGIAIYGGFQHGPLAALIRWAGLDDPAGHDVDAARRAAIVLAWTLSTPHRPTRDHVTKVLVKLLTPRLLVLEELLTRFAEIDDPYIFQRLCVITHGALIAADSDAADAAAQAVRTLAEHVRRRRPTPDLLVDDALRGSLETCERRGFIDAELTEALSVMPRTGLDLPSDTEEQIREAYGSDTGSAAPGYRTLLHSIFGLGDFGIKVVDSDVGTFSFHPIDEPYPTAVETASPLGVIDVSKIVELLSLDEAELEQMLAGTATGGDRVEDPVQESGVAGPTETGDNPDRFPAARARVWIFRRVIELGWTPDLFADFDATVPAVGREAHKPERFGKKYQWIALHELEQ
ncbi:hypothetical protein IU469_26445 [Nocardia puris]|uniref:hypothetical protein n=1 Tax=Nocardia puris TaxID=208602 RepID=UPI001893DF75|nr:hypothetical protein [Nocardia puris]MBF6369226.1 hypothetical protein [Nocardia puris]